MGYYIKKTEQTAPVQAVTESSLKSASEINVPTVKAVLDGLHHPNLLINGDFQINQRGQSSYAINGAYSLDMWLIKQGLKVDIISNGIQITQRDDGSIFLLQQFIQSEMFNNQSFTLDIKSGGKVNSATFVYDDTNHTSSLDAPFVFENAEVGIKVFNHDGKNVFQIYLKVRTLDIEYIDLFEGDISYPHVKEDYAIALMRCMEYLQVCYPFISLSKTWGNSRGSVLTCSYPLKSNIKKNPTITGYSNIWIYSNDTTTNYDTSVNYTVQISNGKLEIRFTKKDGSIFTESNYSMSYQGKFILSSEPL